MGSSYPSWQSAVQSDRSMSIEHEDFVNERGGRPSTTVSGVLNCNVDFDNFQHQQPPDVSHVYNLRIGYIYVIPITDTVILFDCIPYVRATEPYGLRSFTLKHDGTRI